MIGTAVIFLKSTYHTIHSPISAYHVANLYSSMSTAEWMQA